MKFKHISVSRLFECSERGNIEIQNKHKNTHHYEQSPFQEECQYL